MISEYLLDTNIVIAYLNDETEVGERIDAAKSVFLSSIVMGELLFGALESHRAEENLARLQEITDEFAMLDCDRATAWSYANIRRELRKAGRPIPASDLWIAACARQHELTLVTRDAHFDGIDGLSVLRW